MAALWCQVHEGPHCCRKGWQAHAGGYRAMPTAIYKAMPTFIYRAMPVFIYTAMPVFIYRAMVVFIYRAMPVFIYRATRASAIGCRAVSSRRAQQVDLQKG